MVETPCMKKEKFENVLVEVGTNDVKGGWTISGTGATSLSSCQRHSK
jgi:predicted RNA-binding protein with PIN domain